MVSLTGFLQSPSEKFDDKSHQSWISYAFRDTGKLLEDHSADDETTTVSVNRGYTTSPTESGSSITRGKVRANQAVQAFLEAVKDKTGVKLKVAKVDFDKEADQYHVHFAPETSMIQRIF